MDKSLELFTSRIYRKSRSERTVKIYLRALSLYMAFQGYESADKLVEDVKAEKLDMVMSLNRWLDHLAKENKAPGTQIVYTSAVKKFFIVNTDTQDVNWERVDLPKLWRVEEDRVPTKEELRNILNYGGLLDRVLVTFKGSSGVRDVTLTGLRVGDVDLDTYKDVGVVYVKPEITKERIRYVTFITSEARRLLRRYLELRKRRGEQLNDESPLIAARGEPIQSESLSNRWRRLLKKSESAEKHRVFHMLRFHTLRKFFRTNLELAGVSKSFRERLMGHKGEAMDDAYFKPAVEQLLREYRKAIPLLTIMEEIKYEEMRKRQLLDTARLLGFEDDRLKRLEEVLARSKTADEAITEFKRLKDPTFEPAEESLCE